MSFENSTLQRFPDAVLDQPAVARLLSAAEGAAHRSRCGLKRFQQANPVGQAQKNVAHHYDIGNDFYRLFLDKGMQYSCAYFTSDDNTLEEAQQNKLRLIASKLNLKPGQKVLDIGCGWGDMALYLGRMENVKVLGVTLSREQCRSPTRRPRRLGPRRSRALRAARLSRSSRRQFDRIVSVGMFEHVGVHHYDEFFAKVNDLLTRRRRHAAALHRPHEPARHREPVAPEVHLPRRLFAGAVGSVHVGREEQPLGDGSASSCACTMPRRWRIGRAASRPTAPRSRRCTTSASAACGSSI